MPLGCEFDAGRRSLEDSSLSGLSPLAAQAVQQFDEKIKFLAETQQLQAHEIRDLRLSILRSISTTVRRLCGSMPW